ncbi:MAG TPA: 3-oxoacyl-[acyl-carrier-protein] synthase III C-terminal domain-containing protein, partial [Candidatus Paceibacterota bacterium]|nr:3-oxoacyl-[acyl-carrier-protein] synthase III C-terminal domain-containing protein [Candidatus Paceibacterota bacterium]
GFRNREPDDPRFHCVAMDGAKIFNFTLKRVPSVVEETLRQSGNTPETVDYFIFHQSNLFIMRHLAKVLHIPEAKLPITIQRFGSAGGPSVPLTLAQGGLERPLDRALRLLIVGYGVGLSWGTALVSLSADALLDHVVVRESTE